MLDLEFIVQNPDVVRHAIEVKGVDLDLERVLALYEESKSLLTQVEELRHERNVLSKQTGSASEAERSQLIEQSRDVGRRLKDLEPTLREKQEQLQELLLLVPNIPGPGEPVGADEEANVEVRRWSEPPDFLYEPRDHVELLEMHDWADLARIGKVAGSRTYALKGDALRLELAVLRLAVDAMAARGFTLIGLPSFAREAAFVGTGHFPTGRDDVYRLDDDLYLSGTAEVGLNQLHGGEIVAEAGLPIRYAGFSPCFRREAGAAGRDVRGLLRIHQFYKVEQYVACVADPEESARWFEALLSNAEALVQALELPYRVVQLCTGEMGPGKVRTWDIECWIPAQQQYRETHSVSEYYDWQARRADLRYRDNDGRVRYVYTLNNTAIATPRILAPFLEVHQQPDGSVRVPEALRPHLGGVEILAAA
ncbi:MAG: serine--tRNA ligase, partial [Dehalococcoidia bacterium]|nr:serine--tRNA ligase [Dehalococcoidia bacterium]